MYNYVCRYSPEAQKAERSFPNDDELWRFEKKKKTEGERLSRGPPFMLLKVK